MDPSKLKAEKQERERQLKLAREAAEEEERLRILEDENEKRLLYLSQSAQIIEDSDERMREFEAQESVRIEWESFLSCSSYFPSLTRLDLVNTYLSQWTINSNREGKKLPIILKYTPEILKLLDEMRVFLEFPPDNVPVENLIEMGITYQETKKRLQKLIDQSSYRILTDLRPLYDPEVGIIESQVGIPEVIHSLWINLYSRPEFRGYSFTDVDFRFKMPDSLVLTRGAYRLVKCSYDPFSDTSGTFFIPGTTHYFKTSIQNWIWKESPLSISRSSPSPHAGELGELEAVNEEQVSQTFLLRRKWKSMGMRKKGTEGGRKEKSSGGRNASILKGQTTTDSNAPATSPTQRETQLISPNTTQPEVREELKLMSQDQESQTPSIPHSNQEAQSPEEIVPLPKDLEDSRDRSIESKGRRGKGSKDGKEERTKTEAELAKERERKEKRAFLPTLQYPHELNLRNYRILGGIFDFRLLKIPPQPKESIRDDGWTLHDVEVDGGIREVEFVADYVPPPSPTDQQEVKRTPEEMEREAKRQEEELQKLVLVEIKVPKTALWFEPPTIVRWDERLRIWSTQGFFDPKFNEDSLQLSFRTARFGVIGLGHNRWSNLPYQSWEMKPNGENGATLTLMASIAVLEFTFKNDSVCISSLQNVGNSDVVETILMGRYMKPRELIQALRCHGLDVFPERDSYAYVDGILIKSAEAEDHLYQCMALAATAFNFHWSRWNLLAGRNKMVYQIRERDGTTTPGNFQMVLNTPRSVGLIDCTEVSPNYSEKPAGDYHYYADLIHLIRSNASEGAKAKMEVATSGQFAETVRILLVSIKPLSFA